MLQPLYKLIPDLIDTIKGYSELNTDCSLTLVANANLRARSARFFSAQGLIGINIFQYFHVKILSLLFN